MADIFYCPNQECPHLKEHKESYMCEFKEECPHCGKTTIEECYDLEGNFIE